MTARLHYWYLTHPRWGRPLLVLGVLHTLALLATVTAPTASASTNAMPSASMMIPALGRPGRARSDFQRAMSGPTGSRVAIDGDASPPAPLRLASRVQLRDEVRAE